MKKNICFLILIITLCFHGVAAQEYLDYYETINKAEIASLDEKYELSASLYETAFNLVDNPFKEDFLFAGLLYEKIDNPEKTYKLLVEGVKKGLTLKRVRKMTTSFKKTREWDKFKNEYKTIREKYLDSLNSEFRIEIAQMIRKDQKARVPIFGSWKKMKKVDTYNFNRLIELIKSNDNKWIGFSTIGETTPKGKYDVTDNISLMLLHFKKEQIEILKPYIFQAVLDGEMYPYQYARIIDYTTGMRILSTKNDKGVSEIDSCSLYGAYLNSKVCDCSIAEIEREKIGFEPLKDFYRKVNSNYQCHSAK